MATAEFEYDPKEGLLDEIERIVAPPQSDDSKNIKNPNEREYYRRPGKAHNHDYCDSCGEGGDLLCCDRCPASFHLECNDPPIDADDFPTGDWLCKRCESRPVIKTEPMDIDDAASTCSSRHSDTATSRRSCSQRPSPVPMWSDTDLLSELDPREVSLRPLTVLARVASQMNPRQFELPKELTCPVQFPGSSKKPVWKPGSKAKTEPANKTVIAMENALVPLPAKFCFVCQKTCRKAPLLQCDYCPTFYHLDCLDPPMTSVPQGRWMCPKHVEHFLDSNMLKSTQVTERVKLWDEYSLPIDGHSVKINFLRKVHRRDPPFHYKVPFKRRKTMKVPHAIKCQYRYPSSLLPVKGVDDGSSTTEWLATKTEQEEWLSSIMQFHAEMASHLAPGKKPVSQSTPQAQLPAGAVPAPSPPTPHKPTASIAPVQKHHAVKSVEHMDTDGVVVENGVLTNGLGAEEEEEEELVKQEKGVCSFTNGYSAQADGWERGSNSEARTKRDEAEQSSQVNGPVLSVGGATADNIDASSLESLVKSQHVLDLGSLDSLDPHIIRFLAVQQIKLLKSRVGSGGGGTQVGSSAPTSTVSSVNTTPEGPQLRARALLCPVKDHAGDPIAMCYRNLTIGVASDTSMCLSQFGQCRFTSAKHACIFYDEMGGHFELLNYSCHGTVVDGILFSCDFTDHVVQTPTHQSASQHAPSLLGSVRKMNKRGRGKKAKQHKDVDNEDKIKLEPSDYMVSPHKSVQCACKDSPCNIIGKSGPGWEGTAILHHGSVIQFGCLQFVFSIVDPHPVSISDAAIDKQLSRQLQQNLSMAAT